MLMVLLFIHKWCGEDPVSVSLCLEVLFVLDLSFFSSILQGNLQIHHVGQDGQVSTHLPSLCVCLPWWIIRRCIATGKERGGRGWNSVSPGEMLAVFLVAKDVLKDEDMWTAGLWATSASFWGFR